MTSYKDAAIFGKDFGVIETQGYSYRQDIGYMNSQQY